MDKVVFSNAWEESTLGGLTRNGQLYNDPEFYAYYQETMDSGHENYWMVEPFLMELKRRGFTHFEKFGVNADGEEDASQMTLENLDDWIDPEEYEYYLRHF